MRQCTSSTDNGKTADCEGKFRLPTSLSCSMIVPLWLLSHLPPAAGQEPRETGTINPARIRTTYHVHATPPSGDIDPDELIHAQKPGSGLHARQIRPRNLKIDSMADTSNPHRELLSLTANIIASLVGNNAIATGDLPTLISSVFHSLSTVTSAGKGEVCRNSDPGGADQELDHAGFSDLPRGWQEGEDAQAISGQTLRFSTPEQYRKR